MPPRRFVAPPKDVDLFSGRRIHDMVRLVYSSFLCECRELQYCYHQQVSSDESGSDDIEIEAGKIDDMDQIFVDNKRKTAVHKSKHIIDPYADSEDSLSEEERADFVDGNKESDDKVASDNNCQKCNIERYDLYKQTKNGKRRRTRSFESSDSDGEFESLRQKAPPRENIVKKRLEAIKATMLDSCDEDDYDEFADATLVSDLPRSWTLDVRYASRIKPFKITVRPKSAVNDIMEAIGKDIGIETKSVSVKWRNKILGQWRTLDRIPGFTQSDILEAELRHQRCNLNSKPHKENSRLAKQSPSSGPSVSINVKSDSNKILVNFKTLLTSTIEAVRIYVAESELVDIASVLLSFEGDALNDRQTLSVLGLEAGEEVQFEARILR